MKNIFLFFLLGTVIFSSSGCGAARMSKLLTGHKTTLDNIAFSNASSQEKFDALANTFASVLEEAITFTSTKRSINFVQKFAGQNEKSINAILKNSNNWIDGMSKIEKGMLGVTLARKPYTSKLVDLVPKYEKKINRKIATLKFMGKVAKFLDLKSLFL